MEVNNTIAANNQLGNYLTQLESSDKATLIAVTNTYITAKRNRGDVQSAYIALYNTVKEMENKYGFNVFSANSNAMVIIEEFAEIVERGTNMLTGGITYTCVFNSIEEANAWLATQNNIQIKNLQVDVSRVKLKVLCVKFDYTVLPQPLNSAYQIAEEKKTRIFFSSKHKKFDQKWQKKNPHLTFLTSLKRSWGFRIIGGSVGYFKFIKEKYFVLYSVNLG